MARAYLPSQFHDSHMVVGTRGNIDVETLLKVVLALLAILLALEVVGAVFRFAVDLIRPLIMVALAVLIVLWLLDRL